MAPLTLSSPSPHLTLLHSPSSVESEYALEALQLASHRFDVRRVTLPGGRLSEAELSDLVGRLVGDPVDALVHRGPRYCALGLSLDGADATAVVETLLAHPELLETPVLDDGAAAMIGRCHERADAWAVTGHVCDARPAAIAA